MIRGLPASLLTYSINEQQAAWEQVPQIRQTMMSLEELAIRLFDAGVIRLGEIDSKIQTPVYFDLRVVVSHPQIMRSVAQHLEKLSRNIEHDLLCGVPYAAVPLTAVLSVNTNTPMIMKRKETKMYGTKKILEGIYEKNQKCIVVEDVMTSGGSLMATVGTLRSEGLIVKHAVVVLDLEQGGGGVLTQNGIHAKSIFTITELLHILYEAGKINDETIEVILDNLLECRFSDSDIIMDNSGAYR